VPPRRATWIVLAVALVVRVAFFAATDYQAQSALDPSDYERHAVSIAAGDGYPPSIVADGPSALRPPVYPVVIGGLYALTGDDRDAARLLQLLVLGLLTVVLVGAVARRLLGDRAGVAAMAIAAVYPPLLAYQSTLLSEALAVPLILAAVAAVLRFRDTGDRRWLLATGVLAGLVVLTRFNALVLVPVLALAAAARPRDWRGTAVVLGVAVLVVAPWTIRNAVVLDAFVPVSTQSGYTLAGAYNDVSRGNPDYPGAWVDPGFFTREIGDEFGGGYTAILEADLGEVEQDRELRASALDYIGDHPGYVWTVVWRNVTRVLGLAGPDWDRLTGPAAGLSVGAAAFAAYGFLAALLLAVIGLVRGARLPNAVWIGAALLLLSFVVTQGEPRFRLPLDPLVLVLAGAAVAPVDRRRH
jgi:hypothetical protein